MSGVGRIFKRRWRKADGTWAESRFWSIGFPLPGAERVESAHTDSESKARDLLRRRLEEIGRHEFAPRQDRLRFDELVDLLRADYERKANRSLPNVIYKIKPLSAYFDHWQVRRIDHAVSLQYIDRRLAESAARSTINGELRLLRRMLRLAAQSNRLGRLPMIELLPEENKRHDYVEPRDFDRLLAAIEDPDVRDLVEFLYCSGWRVNSARLLERADVDWTRETIKLRAAISKNKEPMLLGFSEFPKMQAVLLRRREKVRLDCPYLFHREGRPILSFRKEWTRATQAAGLRGLLVHGLCRSAAVNLARAGVDETTAAKWMNRRSLSIYRLYREAGLHMDSRDTEVAGAALENYFQTEKDRAKVAVIRK